VSPETAITELQGALQLALMVAAPLLIATLIVGVVIGLLQAATQINEASVAFIAKFIALAVVLALAGPWMLGRLTEYTAALIQRIPSVLG